MNPDNTTNEAFEDALDDVHTRFLLNLPPEELATADRIFFQLEQAWWFYEDMICDRASPELLMHLPRFSTLKPFALTLFKWSPLLSHMDFNVMWAKFSDYKRKISTYGTILLNMEATHIILCQTWNGNTWTFPAGKINQGEQGLAAAARETFEETGFDPHCLFGETKEWSESSSLSNKISWQFPLADENVLSYQEPNGKRRTCYVCHGVPADFAFAPVARKEISEVKWFDLNDLPKKSFAVLPFIGKLRKWIRKNVHKTKSRAKSRPKSNGRDKSTGRDKSQPKNKRDNSAKRDKKKGGSRPSSRSGSKSRTINDGDDPLVAGGLASVGDDARWSEEDMFRANEVLLGRKVDYDGNPHEFVDKGFGGNDPHAFRVVGGSFMNSSEGVEGVTKEAQKQKYQPLTSSMSSKVPLTPFFTQEGATPWGEVVEEAKGENLPQENPGEALLAMLQQGGGESSKSKGTGGDAAEDIDVLTDVQITAKSQDRKIRAKQQYEDDMKFLEEWVQKLPRPVDFKINVDAILEKHFGSI